MFQRRRKGRWVEVDPQVIRWQRKRKLATASQKQAEQKAKAASEPADKRSVLNLRLFS